MTSVQAWVCTWFCKALESLTCKLVGHPVQYAGTVRYCGRCGRSL